MRVCKVCKIKKDESEFNLHCAGKDYISRTCKDCEAKIKTGRLEDGRLCKTCQKIKPIEEFNLSQKGEGYRRHECKECESARKKKWYNENHEQARVRQNEAAKERYEKKYKHSAEHREKRRLDAIKTRAKYKDLAYKHYGGYVCACCGETEPLFLTLDHVNNDGYMMRKYGKQGTASLYHWLHKHGYPEGYQVLCMNCNFGKARNGGVCPHKSGSTTIPEGSTEQAIGSGSAPHPLYEDDDIVSSVSKDTAA